jgi:ABC-2 type transport system permease protein
VRDCALSLCRIHEISARRLSRARHVCGAISPVSGLPKWLQVIAHIDPFTYAVHGFKAILLKDCGFAAIRFELLFLVGFGIATLAVATPLFKRTL